MRQASSARLVAAGLAFLVVGASPLAAAERPSAPARPAGQIAASVPAALAAAKAARPLLAIQGPSPETTSERPFLKTGKGRLAIALMVVGLGYGVYSLYDDRVKSPGRK